MRTQNSDSTSPRLRNGSKNKGSRVSINSEVNDTTISLFESYDYALPFSEQTDLCTSQQAWAASENAMKTIDKSHSEYYVKKPKLTFHSSGTFQQVLLDMYGATNYNFTPLTVPKLKVISQNQVLSRVVEQRRIENDKEVATKVEKEESATLPLQCSVNRNWKIPKRRVNESPFEYKTQTQKLNWVMLLHSMKQTSSVEKSRKDLYERYGILPTTLPDGTVVCENRMLSDRARAKLYGQTKYSNQDRRPNSYQPPSLQMRSIAKTAYSQLGRLSCNCARITNACYQHKRPKTAQ
ncbi:hypothetical protein DPMN_192689 [Dreissena polymorpha]|uniref:Uncharacterized protein n=1 Tax=Dreissena polymorpha TaxID=45954 RepID=A0A9D3Y4W6_DREPO|nr:hypothetical protein DPMN_192689 [Dreissena polymorpha]